MAIAALIVGGVVGARLGVQFAGRWHDATLERVIAGLLMVIAMLLGIEARLGTRCGVRSWPAKRSL